jgi:hypothetical protein
MPLISPFGSHQVRQTPKQVAFENMSQLGRMVPLSIWIELDDGVAEPSGRVLVRFLGEIRRRWLVGAQNIDSVMNIGDVAIEQDGERLRAGTRLLQSDQLSIGEATELRGGDGDIGPHGFALQLRR